MWLLLDILPPEHGSQLFPKLDRNVYLGDNAGISGLITIHLGVGDDEQQSPTKE